MADRRPLILDANGRPAELVDTDHLTVAKLKGLSGQSGDTLYHDGTEWKRLAKGTDTQVLTLASGLPSWADGGGGVDWIQKVVKTSSAQFISGTSLTDVTDLVVTLPAGGLYWIEVYLYLTSSEASDDVQIAFTSLASLYSSGVLAWTSTAASSVPGFSGFATGTTPAAMADLSGGVIQTGVRSSGISKPTSLRATAILNTLDLPSLDPGTTSETLQLRAAEVANTGGSHAIERGSALVIHKMIVP